MDINQSKLQEYLDNIQTTTNNFTDITEKLIKNYSSDLDDLMSDLRLALTQEDAASTDTIERYYAELTNLIYFKAETLEKLSVFKDMSKAMNKEAYNKAYISFSAEKDEKGKSLRTVSENTALAESTTQYESTTSLIYASVYDAIDCKISMAQEMVTTLKNILKKRINEAYMNFQLSSSKNGTEELRGE